MFQVHPSRSDVRGFPTQARIFLPCSVHSQGPHRPEKIWTDCPWRSVASLQSAQVISTQGNKSISYINVFVILQSIERESFSLAVFFSQKGKKRKKGIFSQKPFTIPNLTSKFALCIFSRLMQSAKLAGHHFPVIIYALAEIPHPTPALLPRHPPGPATGLLCRSKTALARGRSR